MADKGQEPVRVDKFLMNRIENATRNKIQKAAKSGYIFSNENPVIIFVSGKKSSHGKMLYDSCKKVNPNSYFTRPLF